MTMRTSSAGNVFGGTSGSSSGAAMSQICASMIPSIGLSLW